MVAPFHFEHAARTPPTDTDQWAEKDEEFDTRVPGPSPSSSWWSVKTFLFILSLPFLPILLVSMIEASYPGLSLPEIMTSWTRSLNHYHHHMYSPRKRQSYHDSSHHRVDLNQYKLFEPVDPSSIDYTALAPYLDSDSTNTTSSSSSSSSSLNTSTSSLASSLNTIYSTTISLTALILTTLPCALINSSSSSSSSSSSTAGPPSTIPHIHSLSTKLSSSLLGHQETYFDTPSHLFTDAVTTTHDALPATEIQKGSWAWFAARHLHIVPYWPGGELTPAEQAHRDAETAYQGAVYAREAHQTGRGYMVEARARVDSFTNELEELWRLVGGGIVIDGEEVEGGHEGKDIRLVGRGEGGYGGEHGKSGGGWFSGGVSGVNDLEDQVEVWYFEQAARRVGMTWDVFEMWWQGLSCGEGKDV